jgi:hypothetical protein
MKAARTFLTFSMTVGLWASMPAAMAQYPLPGALAGLADSVVEPPALVVVFGSDWLPNSVVDLTLFSAPVPLGNAQVDGDGEFSKVVKIPAGTAPGQHSIRVQGTAENGQPDTVFLSLQVLGAGSDAGAGAGGGGQAQPEPPQALTLPFTGVEIRMWMPSALIVFLLGLLALMVGRRRARDASYD